MELFTHVGYQDIIEPELPHCDYCGKPGAQYYAEIWRNHRIVSGVYCNIECSNHAQMSAEG